MPPASKKPPQLRRIVAKPLVAVDPSRSSLARLPTEILITVVELLEPADRSTAASLRLVCSAFYALVRHRTLCFHLRSGAQAGTAQSFEIIRQRCAYIESQHLLSAVQQLTIIDEVVDPFWLRRVLERQPPPRRANGCNPRRALATARRLLGLGKNTPSTAADVDPREECLTTLCRLIPLMISLSSVKYQSNRVPTGVVTMLKGLPHVSLLTKIDETLYIGGSVAPDANTFQLQDNLNLHTLDVRIIYSTTAECLQVMRPLKRLLLSCPNIRCLTFDIYEFERPGENAAGPQYCGLGFKDGERIPALEMLEVISYPFGLEDNGYGPFGSIGYPTAGREGEYWADNFDWSRLKVLRTSEWVLACRAASKLCALTDIEFIEGWQRFGTNTSEFFTRVPGALRSISVPTLSTVTLQGIFYHSQTLRKLRIHAAEYLPNWCEYVIDIASLERIRTECRLITDLAIDVVRSDDLPYGVFDVLAAFPNLITLELWFELGIHHYKDPIKPVITSKVAEHIFRYLRSHCPSNTPRLRRLVTHAGATPRMGSWYPPAGCTFEPLGPPNSVFVCELSQQAEEAAAGIFTIKQIRG